MKELHIEAFRILPVQKKKKIYIYSYIFPRRILSSAFVQIHFSELPENNKRQGRTTMHVLEKADLLCKMNALTAKL